jgi:peptide/nickel transport system permease protein
MSDTSTTIHLGDIRQAERGRFWRQFRRHKLAVLSAALLVVLTLAIIFADFIVPYNPNATNTAYARGKPQPPTAEYVLGTDNYGRDYLSRTIVGTRISMVVGVVAVVFQITIGVTVGALAGYLGGWADNLLMRVTDIFLSIPTFFLLLIIAGILEGTLMGVIFAIGALNWMTVARLVRAEFMSLKQQEYVMAARALGTPGWRIVLYHLLPNSLAPIIVAATLAVPNAILTESALSFLGLGVPPPHASLGKMLQEAQQFIRTSWWMWIVPGAAISMIVLAFNFLGDGLRDALDPRLRN